MNERLAKLNATVKEKWSKWTALQKVILFGIIAAVIVAVVLLFAFSSKPATVPVFSTPITDEDARFKIVTRIEEANVKPDVSPAGLISVKDEATARRMRSILISEGLVPGSVDPFSLFDVSSWSRNDFKDAVDWQRSIQNLVKQVLEAHPDVQTATVALALPEKQLFSSQQNPVTASIGVKPVFGSDLATNKRKVRGLQNLVLRAVEGLTEDNITIVDFDTGEEINDFAGMQASEEVDNIGKQLKMLQKQEAKYRVDILSHLQQLYGDDRVRDLSVKLEMDMSKKVVDSTEYGAIQIRADNPDTPYDDSEYRDYLPISFETVDKKWEGTGYNPEGPAGVEGQNPPVYSDMTNVMGTQTEKGVKQNNAINTTITHSERSPELARRTVSVNIDGVWTKKKDDKGRVIIENGGIAREYHAIADEEIQSAVRLVQNAIGYDRSRGDSVVVTNIQIDRSADFEKEDAAYFARINRNRTLMLSLGGILLVLLIFIIFRAISREMERRKRLREEELLRQQQLAREAALAEANAQGMDVTMSVEERKRAELQENAIAMAKEHPEDVAMLIRTWLMEE